MPWTRPSSPSCCNSSAGGWPAIGAASAPPWGEFVGHPAYNVGELRQDLDRFTFLLGGDDGESLFGHGTAE
jgi:hypothetical protein